MKYNIDSRFKIILLKGEMGAGKTFFVKQYMLEKYNFNEVSSPTYAFLNIYVVNNMHIAHFDFYLKHDMNVFLDALLYYDLIFVEWFPVHILSHLKDYVIVDCDNKIINYY